nr:ATP-binding cassette domain-containing protein [Haloquadratum walsbyi]
MSFEVHQDGSITFVGQSGAGKSTIASLIARLYEPDEGSIGTSRMSRNFQRQ